jgi:hypothetical protein
MTEWVGASQSQPRPFGRLVLVGLIFLPLAGGCAASGCGRGTRRYGGPVAAARHLLVLAERLPYVTLLLRVRR